MDNIRVLLVDDHHVVRRGLKDLIRSEPGFETVGEAEDGDDAVSKAQELHPDVIVMDLLMPKKPGVEAIREIKAIMPDANILVLTSSQEMDEIKQALRAGALGFILKMDPPEELIRALRKVAAGAPVFNDALMLEMIASDGNEVPDPIVLTKKEEQLTRLIGQGMTNKEISEQMFLEEASVKVYVTRLLKKLGLDNRTKVALYAVKAGLIRMK